MRSTWIVIAVSLAISAGAPAVRGDELSITLPLGDSCRAGRYVPVRLANTPDRARLVVVGDGFVPATFDSRELRSEVIVPVLVTASQISVAGVSDGNSGYTATRRPVEAHDTGTAPIVGLVGSATDADAREMQPGGRCVTVKLDWPLTGPAVAWEALDAIVIADAALPDDATLSTLLAAGVTFVVKSDHAPDANWPWQREANGWWRLAHTPLGPAGSTFDAAPLLASWSPGVSAASRRNAMLIGVIVAVLLLAASLRRGRAAIVALVVAAVGSVVAIVIWSASQSPVRVAGGVIEVRSAALMQSDVWFCQAATRSTGMRTRARGLLHPLASPELLAQTGMTLVCERDGTPVEFQWGADVGMKMAFMSRRVEVSKNAATRTMSLAGSPLRFIAQEAYPGALLVAEERDSAPSGDVVERWPRIILTPATKRAGH